MVDETTITALRQAIDTETVGHTLSRDQATTAWETAHAHRQYRIGTWVSVAASVLVVAAAALAIPITRDRHRVTSPAGASTCAGTVATTALPTWARSGFSPDGLDVPHVTGANQTIVAVLFGQLRAHPAKGTHNKILWVAKDGAGPLRIDARLDGSTTTVTRTVDLGPSVVDLPAAGCWDLTLSWPGHSDTMAVRYQP